MSDAVSKLLISFISRIECFWFIFQGILPRATNQQHDNYRFGIVLAKSRLPSMWFLENVVLLGQIGIFFKLLWQREVTGHRCTASQRPGLCLCLKVICIGGEEAVGPELNWSTLSLAAGHSLPAMCVEKLYPGAASR